MDKFIFPAPLRHDCIAPVNGLRRVAPGAHALDHGGRSCGGVASGINPGLAGGLCVLVHLNQSPFQGKAVFVAQETQIHLLPRCHQNGVRRYPESLLPVVPGIETPVLILDGGTAHKLHSRDLAALIDCL